MKHLLLATILALGSVAFVPSSRAASSSDTDARKREVLQVEQKRLDALQRDDHATLGRILSDDLTYTHSSSIFETKAQFLESLTSGRTKYHSMKHDTSMVRVFGETAVITTTTSVKLVSSGKDLDLKLRATIVYARQGGDWKMVAWQSTRVQP